MKPRKKYLGRRARILRQTRSPILSGREMIEAFLQARPPRSARDVEHQHHDHILYLPVDDPFVALNINTPDDYAGLPARSPD